MKRNTVPPPPGDRKAGRQPSTLLEAHTHSHMHTDSQKYVTYTVRMNLTFEFTALGWFKSLPTVFFLLISSRRFDIGTSQNLASCLKRRIFTIHIYSISVNSNLLSITVGSFEFIGVMPQSHTHLRTLRMIRKALPQLSVHSVTIRI